MNELIKNNPYLKAEQYITEFDEDFFSNISVKSRGVNGMFGNVPLFTVAHFGTLETLKYMLLRTDVDKTVLNDENKNFSHVLKFNKDVLGKKPKKDYKIKVDWNYSDKTISIELIKKILVK